MFRRYDVKSALVIPLIIRGETGGLAYFNYHSRPVVFTDQQIDFSQKLAISITLALENSRLYQTEHRIAEVLQEALLALPAKINGIEFGHLYRSATEAAKIGGDFYDVFEIENGKVGIIIGDVSGKGISAAALTTVVKNTIKTHAYGGSTPAAIISRTNGMVLRSAFDDGFVTVFFAILDLKTGRLLYCSAGHPPAIIKRRSGEMDLLDSQSPLIGAFLDVSYRGGKASLKRGDTLVLYTDGATEACCGEDRFGQTRFVNLVSGFAPMPAKEMPQTIFKGVMKHSGGQLSDDLALLTVALEGMAADLAD